MTKRRGSKRKSLAQREPSGKVSRAVHVEAVTPTPETIRHREARLGEARMFADPELVIGWLLGAGSITVEEHETLGHWRAGMCAVHGEPMGRSSRLSDASSGIGAGPSEAFEAFIKARNAAMDAMGRKYLSTLVRVVWCNMPSAAGPEWVTAADLRVIRKAVQIIDESVGKTGRKAA